MEQISHFIYSDSPSGNELESFQSTSRQAENEGKVENKRAHVSQTLSPKCKKEKKPRLVKSKRKGNGRDTDQVPNLVKKLIDFIKKHGNQVLLTSSILKPISWTMKAELILLCLKYRILELRDRNLFITEIRKILDKMISFRNRKIEEMERIEFHQKNRDILEKVKKTCLRLLNKPDMPEPNEIRSILTELIRMGDRNRGSLTVQSSKINEAYQYILQQFPEYSGENEQTNFEPILDPEAMIENLVIGLPPLEPIFYEKPAMKEQHFVLDSSLDESQDYYHPDFGIYFGIEEQEPQKFSFDSESQPQYLVFKQDFEVKYRPLTQLMCNPYNQRHFARICEGNHYDI